MATTIELNAVPEDTSTWWWRRFRVSVPEGSRGNWQIRRITVSKQQAYVDMMRNLYKGQVERSVAADEYTQLLYCGDIIMSDTPAEIKDHLEFFSMMRGDVLIFGLGLGMAAKTALQDPEVRSVRVVELDPDVIALTAPSLSEEFGDKLEIVQADAFTYHRTCKDTFDVVWHDIWPTISRANLPQMKKLKRAWAKRARWQGFWAQPECESMNRGRL
jgi:spermidine synthase